MRLPAFLAVLLLLSALGSGCLQDGEGDGDKTSDPGDGEPVEPGAVEVEWGPRDEAIVRPGAPMQNGCVFNWLFTDADGTAFVGTAAHCTSLHERVRERESESVVGTVVFDSDETQGADPRLDFSLIRFDPGFEQQAHPAMLGFDGPSGVVSPGDVAVGDQVGFHGHGQYLGEQDETRDRMGVVMEVTEQEYRANMPAVEGDSGSPVLHVESGQALGIVSRYGVWDVLDAQVPSTDVGPLMVWVLEELEQAGFLVELATV